jgi:uncharacterized protein CbrC (UPF0167 family)
MNAYKLTQRKEHWHVLAEDSWRGSVSGRTFCHSCARVRRDLYPRPIDIKLQQTMAPGRSIGHSSLAVIGFVHTRLLARLERHLTDFALGDVYDESGAKLQNHRTFYSASSIAVRGSAGSDIRQCLICGEILCIERGEPYVLRHQLRDRHVFQDAISTTYVDEWLAGQIDWKEFKDIKLVPIPIRDHPEDGWRLPGDPDWSALGIPCKEWQSKVLNIPSLKNQDMGPWTPEGNKQNGDDTQAAVGKGVPTPSLVVPASPVVPPTLPPPLPPVQLPEFKYFDGPLADMAGFAGETKPCSLCGRTGPCFELEHAICPEVPQGGREGKIGCYDCLRAGRFEFVHTTEIGTVGQEGLRSERTGKLYLPKGFLEGALVELSRTPPIATNQEEIWLTHCNDFMACQGVWDPGDFCENAPDGDGRALFLVMTDPDGQDLWKEGDDETEARAMWYGTYYVFKCRHCGKLRGNWDVD